MKHGTITILLLEDDDVDARIANRSLKRASINEADRIQYSLKRAVTLKEAIQLCQEQQPDVVLSDLNVPDSKGFDTISAFLDVRLRQRSLP